MSILDTTGWDWGGGSGDAELIPDGTRCKSKITRVTFATRKTDQSKYLIVAFESIEHPDADEFVEFLDFMSNKRGTARDRRRESAKWESFRTCFGLYINNDGQTDTKDWLHREGLVEIGVKDGGKESSGKDRGNVNYIKEYVVSHDSEDEE